MYNFSDDTMDEIKQNLKDVFHIEISAEEIESIMKNDDPIQHIWDITVAKHNNHLHEYIAKEFPIIFPDKTLLDIIKSHTITSTLYTLKELTTERKSFSDLENSTYYKYKFLKKPSKKAVVEDYGFNDNDLRQLKKQCSKITEECADSINNKNPLYYAFENSTLIYPIVSNRKGKEGSDNEFNENNYTKNKFYYKSNHPV